MIALALYKAPAPMFTSDWMIRTWTRSLYSHSEIVIEDVMYSSSIIDGGVRAKVHHYDPAKWDYIDLPDTLDIRSMIYRFELEKGAGYDYWGIVFSEIIPFGISHPHRWYCSELNAAMLKCGGLMSLCGRQATMSPARLGQLITK